MSEAKEPKKRGAPKKAKVLDSRIAFRCSFELEQWLESEGSLRELDKSAMARTLLVELMIKGKKKK